MSEAVNVPEATPIIEVARELERARGLQRLEFEEGYPDVLGWLDGNGDLQLDGLDEYRDFPRRANGTRLFDAADGFIEAVQQSAVLDGNRVTIWADSEKTTVTAIFNDGAARPGWRDHRAVLRLQASPALAVWKRADGSLMSQEDFAEFIEDNLPDIQAPDAATLLEIVTSLVQTKEVDFKQSTRLTDGQSRLRYEETTTSRAGQNGELEVPESFTIAVPIWRAGRTAYQLKARLRHRIRNGQLHIGFRLERLSDIVDASFHEVTEQIISETGISVWDGVA